MLANLHNDIKFQNISNGEVTAESAGLNEFRTLAEQAKALFRSRELVIETVTEDQDKTILHINFSGELAVDLPIGLKAGQIIELNGRSAIGAAVTRRGGCRAKRKTQQNRLQGGH